MLRGTRLVLCGLAILATSGWEARSQYFTPYGNGYAGYGFGGWSSTPQGGIARGLGAFAESEGVYNVETAQAEAIDADTVMRFNQYVYASHLESQRRYNASQTRRLNLDKAGYEARQARIRDNPTPEDITSGNALNVILDQLTDPKVMRGSGLRMANASLSPKAIREIPFRDETDAITLSLDQLTDPKAWPLPLRADALTPEREAYQKAIDDALAEDKDGGSLKPETVAKVRDAVARLYQKVQDTIPKTKQPDHTQAMNYLKGLAGMSRMLEKPNVEAILAELEKVETTTVGNLVAFMHAYNLRFAPAETPKQRAVYNDLYPVMAQSREKVLGKPGDANPNPNANADTPPPPPVENPTALFNGVDSTHLNPKPRDPNKP